jgi:hypothetical protein
MISFCYPLLIAVIVEAINSKLFNNNTTPVFFYTLCFLNILYMGKLTKWFKVLIFFSSICSFTVGLAVAAYSLDESNLWIFAIPIGLFKGILIACVMTGLRLSINTSE